MFVSESEFGYGSGIVSRVDPLDQTEWRESFHSVDRQRAQ